MPDARVVLEGYAAEDVEGHPRHRYAPEAFDVLQAVLDLCYADTTSDRRAYQLGWDIREIVIRELRKP